MRKNPPWTIRPSRAVFLVLRVSISKSIHWLIDEIDNVNYLNLKLLQKNVLFG